MIKYFFYLMLFIGLCFFIQYVYLNHYYLELCKKLSFLSGQEKQMIQDVNRLKREYLKKKYGDDFKDFLKTFNFIESSDHNIYEL